MHYQTAASRKKMHPADAYHAAQVARATGYSVWFRTGPQETHKEAAATVEDAKAIATRMNAEFGAFGRRAVVYALTPEGASYPI